MEQKIDLLIGEVESIYTQISKLEINEELRRKTIKLNFEIKELGRLYYNNYIEYHGTSVFIYFKNEQELKEFQYNLIIIRQYFENVRKVMYGLFLCELLFKKMKIEHTTRIKFEDGLIRYAKELATKKMEESKKYVEALKDGK